MRQVKKVPPDLVQRMGQSVKTIGSGPVYRSLQIAWALQVSEQTVSTWARQGRIPPGEMVMGVRWWNIAELEVIASRGVQPVGTYLPPSVSELARLESNKPAAQRARRAAKKGGAK